MKALMPAFAFLAVATFLPLLSSCSRDAGPARHVFLITVDALRADAVSFSKSAFLRDRHGRQLVTTPHIDELAADSVYFENAVSQHFVTQPSVAALLSGRYPVFESPNTPWESCGMARFYRTTETVRELPLGLNTAPEIFKDSGFYTMAFQTNPHLLKKTNFAQGVDHFEDFEMYFRKGFPLKLYPDGSHVIDKALEQIREHKDTSLFVWLYFMDVHFPYMPPAGWRKRCGLRFLGAADDSKINEAYQNLFFATEGKPLKPGRAKPEDMGISLEELTRHAKALYLGCVCYTDGVLGQFLSSLKEMGIYESSLIVLTADHGDEFLEHGGVLHSAKRLHVEELIRVPLIVKFPNNQHKGRISCQVRLIDVLPTLVGYFFPGNTGLRFDGRSLLDMIQGREGAERPAFFCTYDMHMVRMNGEKYIYSKRDQREYFFDLKSDPLERKNLAAACQEKVEFHRKFHKEQLEKLKIGSRHMPPKSAPQSEEIRRRLRGLGYVD